MRGVAQIKLDDSYVQQKRPVSMVSPSIKPMSPFLESSLCDRRQQVIQHRAKAFMGDVGYGSSNKNAYDNNNYENVHNGDSGDINVNSGNDCDNDDDVNNGDDDGIEEQF